MTKFKEFNRLPRITIISSTFNCAEALKKTANSIRSQTYKNIQWIVADGASTDGTVEVIKENQDIITEWISEPDRGIYDAWNKVCKHIDGEWVLFLGAGDLLYHDMVLSEFWENVPTDFNQHLILYGNVLIIKPDGKKRYVCRKPKLDFWEFGRPALPHHQGVFQNKKNFSVSPFDSSYKIAADSKFLLQALKHGTAMHINITVAEMSDDGISNDIKNYLIAQREIKRLCIDLGIKVPVLYQIRANSKRFVYFLAHLILPGQIKTVIQNFIDRFRAIKKT
jgi:glycosyltransferase involved in cell wall biosynthesis